MLSDTVPRPDGRPRPALEEFVSTVSSAPVPTTPNDPPTPVGAPILILGFAAVVAVILARLLHRRPVDEP
jgi:hypothetical protein